MLMITLKKNNLKLEKTQMSIKKKGLKIRDKFVGVQLINDVVLVSGIQ